MADIVSLILGPIDDNQLPRETLSQRDGPFRPRPERSPARQRHLEYERARGRLETPNQMTAQDNKILGEISQRYHLRAVNTDEYLNVSTASENTRTNRPGGAFPKRSTLR